MANPRELIIPVFIPHSGCTHRCVFCAQNDITGRQSPPGPEEVEAMLSDRLGPETSEAVVAFYGGSFTCMPLPVQEGCLDAAGHFVGKGHAAYIRLSTRPDCIDGSVAQFLYSRRVRVVELGAQSMDDRVLSISARGHTASYTADAAGALKAAGIRLGIQIMAGLPGDSREGFIRTVREVVALGPEFVRIYPVLVVRRTPLERLYRRGEYEPLGLDEAVSWCADAHEIFGDAGIKVVRTGLQPSSSLESALVDGPYHPAFGHLAGSEVALRRMVSLMDSRETPVQGQDIQFLVNGTELSKYLGIGKKNLDKLRRLYGNTLAIRADDSVDEGDVLLRSA